MGFHPITLPDSALRHVIHVSAIPVSAGFPSPATDHLEDEIDPIAWAVPRPGSTFWWRVEGDCLIDRGIHDGDLIAVDRDSRKRVGQIVLAVIDGEIVAKVLGKDRTGYWLEPANRRGGYSRMPFTESTEVWGVVVCVIRKYDAP